MPARGEPPSYARGEAPLGYAEPSDDRVIEYDEDVLATLDQEYDFAWES